MSEVCQPLARQAVWAIGGDEEDSSDEKCQLMVIRYERDKLDVSRYSDTYKQGINNGRAKQKASRVAQISVKKIRSASVRLEQLHEAVLMMTMIVHRLVDSSTLRGVGIGRLSTNPILPDLECQEIVDAIFNTLNFS